LFGGPSKRLGVALESLLRRTEEKPGTSVARGSVGRREARGECQSERDERRGKEAENGETAWARRQRSQRAIGIRIP
jgi:hypothetical protein